VRAAEPGSWYFWASTSAASRSDATPVANDMRTKPPGGRRTRWRKLTTGSSTAPTVPDSARPSRAIGSSVERPRPRNRARSLSHSTGPCMRPSMLSTCTAKRFGSSAARGRRPEDGALGHEGDQVLLGLVARRLVGRGPDEARAHVAEIDELAADVARAVLTRPGDHPAPARAVAAAGVGDDGGIGAVGKEV